VTDKAFVGESGLQVAAYRNSIIALGTHYLNKLYTKRPLLNALPPPHVRALSQHCNILDNHGRFCACSESSLQVSYSVLKKFV
jgi:hypothetical protein